jgi:2-O-methyltransferase
MKYVFLVVLAGIVSGLIAKDPIIINGGPDAFGIVAPYLPKNPNVLEAGAFDGADSVVMSKVWPSGTIFTFEPAPDLYQRLLKRVKSQRNVFPYPFALGDKKSVATFHISNNDNDLEHTSMSSSLLAPKEHLVHAPEVVFEKEVPVFVTTIDEWARDYGIDHIDFMWLDMQGSELQALQASPNILKTVKAIYTEVEMVEAYEGQSLFKDVRRWLESQGFTLVATTFNIRNPNWFGDALFIRK